MSSKPLHVGVLLFNGAQLLDAAAVDLLGMLTPEYLRHCRLPDQLVALGQEMVFHYIAESRTDGGDSVYLTAAFGCKVTDTIASVGHLDIILIPGLDSSFRPSPALQSFLQTRLPDLKALLVVCTGSVVAAFSGILSGKTATAPRIILPMLKKSLPDVNWVEQRWANDGNIWTSGLVTNGIDMVAAFIKAEYPELAEFVCECADVPERSGTYEKPMSVLKAFVTSEQPF